jgi:hypothetical protein
MSGVDSEFFLGVMVLKEGKWTPHTKFDGGAFGRALMRAEELDKDTGFDAVKVVKVPKSGKGEQKEMWISPRIKARAEAQSATQLRQGVKQTSEQLAAARKASIKQ